MSFQYSAAITLLTLSLLSTAPLLYGEESNPYYFADDTIEKKDIHTRPRTIHSGARVFKKGDTKEDIPEYRRQRSPLKDLKYLVAGKYEAKIAGILCNSCTDSVLQQLKKFPQIHAATFDFEEGTLRFTVAAYPKTKKQGTSPRKQKKYRPLHFRKFQKAIRRAGKRVRLGTRFSLAEIQKIR